MTVERFTAENSALLLIDHQVGTMKLIKNIDRDQAARQSIALAKMARSKRPGVANEWAYPDDVWKISGKSTQSRVKLNAVRQ